MAKNQVYIDIIIDDKGTTKRLAVDADKLGLELDKVGKSARTADRNIKGVAATSSSSTKNFSKMSQGMGGLVAAYATLAATIFAVSAAYRFLKNAADLANLQQSQNEFAANTGVAMNIVVSGLERASQGMMAFKEAAEAASIGIAQGFSGKQMEILAKGAVKISSSLGRSYEDVFDRLMKGVGKAEPELLDELGIILRLDTATRRYADSIGVSQKSLTAFQRQQAVMLEVQTQLQEKFADREALTNPFKQLEVAFDEVVRKIMTEIIPAFNKMATFISSNADIAMSAFTLFGLRILMTIPGVLGLGAAFSKAFTSIGTKIAGLGPKLKNLKESLKAAPANAVQAWTDFKGAISRARAEIAKIQAEKDRLAKHGVIRGRAAGRKALKEGDGKSAILKKMKEGKKLHKGDINNLNKALASAERQYKEHGKVTKGIFKNTSAATRAMVRKAVAEQVAGSKKWYQSQKLAAASVKRVTSVAYKGMVKTAKGAYTVMKVGAKTMAKVVGGAMKGLMILQVLSLVLLMFQRIMESPATVVRNVIKMVSSIARSIQFLLNMGIKAMEAARKAMGFEGSPIVTEFKFADGMEKEWTDAFNNSAAGKAMQGHEDEENKRKAHEARLTDIKEAIKELNKEMVLLSTGIGAAYNAGLKKLNDELKTEEDKLRGGWVRGAAAEPIRERIELIEEEIAITTKLNKIKAELMTSKAVASLGINEMITKALADAGGKAGEYEKLITERLGKLKDQDGNPLENLVLSDDMLKAIADQDTATVTRLQNLNQSFVNSATQFNDEIKNAGSKLKDGGEEYIDRLAALSASLEEAGEGLDYSQYSRDKLNNIFSVFAEGGVGGFDAYKAALVETRKESYRTELVTKELAEASQKLTGVNFKGIKVAKANIANLQAENTLADQRNKLREAERILVGMNDPNELMGVFNDKEKADQKHLIELAKADVNIAESKAAITATNIKLQEIELGLVNKKFELELKSIDLNNEKLRAGGTTGLFKERLMNEITARQTLLAIAKSQTEIDAKRLRVLALQADLALINAGLMIGTNNEQEQLDSLNDQIENLLRKKQGLEIQHDQAKDNLNDIKTLGKSVGESLQSSMQTAFQGLIEGTISAKQAFANMAKAILSDIAKMITKMMVFRMLEGAFGTSDFGKFLGFSPESTRYGGIVTPRGKLPGYATGGVARGSQAGYPVMMHGTEAVVPLPNGNSIPVEMSGNGTNNISINVNMDSAGNSQASGDQGKDTGGKLGKLLAAAVQDELHKQKRPGGLLSPLGATG